MQVAGSLGERIVALRTERKESQAELADAIMIDRSSISRWEKGVRFPDDDTIRKIARHFGVDPSVLLSAPQLAPVRDGKLTVLCVEDAPPLLDELLFTLRGTIPDAQVVGFRSSVGALRFAAQTQTDVAFLDIELIGESGLDLARRLQELNPRTNIIFLTCHPEYSGDAFALFASGYVLKPLTEKKVREQLAHLRYAAGAQA